jgi:hypothetical protein
MVSGSIRNLEHHLYKARRTVEVAGAAQQFAEQERGPDFVTDTAGGVGFGHNLFQQRPDRDRVAGPNLLGQFHRSLDSLSRRCGRGQLRTQSLQLVRRNTRTTHGWTLVSIVLTLPKSSTLQCRDCSHQSNGKPGV